MYKKEQYKEILEYIQEDLELCDCMMKSLLFQNKCELNDEIETFLFAKSKRLRPLVLFLVADALNVKVTENIVKLSVALELLHSATLIHDDIIDEAKTRRLNQTFYDKFGPKIATIAGDYILSLCLNLLSDIGYAKIFQYFSKNTMNICNGEINQFFNRGKIITLDEYIEKSKKKTSSLFEAGVKSLLYLINKEIKPVKDNVQNGLDGFVSNFALGFQIYDDIENFLNVNIEKESSDIKNGIYTLPYLYLSQQNYSYDIIDNKKRSEAFEYSKRYLDTVLDNAIKNLNGTEGVCKTDMLTKLADTFRIRK